MSERDVDVLIVGAGVSGIGAACHLEMACPDKTYAILERRRDLGGTWDLFRYPGIRSDSDMLTFGYRFRPWRGAKVLADGRSIKRYLAETAREFGVDAHIRFGRRVERAAWSSAEARWTLEAQCEETGETEVTTGRFLVSATGYYDYDAGYRPRVPGEERFRGPIVHPQHWPADLDTTGKRVIVIGSGATAITLVPALAATAEHVTMLQRSPTWLLSVPTVDKLAARLDRILPAVAAYRLGRARNVVLQALFYRACRRYPRLMRRLLLKGVREQLRGAADMRHFTPDYAPWDQRLCAVADGDLFKAIRAGKASVETDHIAHFTEGGLALRSGKELEADLIVTATGLEVQLLGGIALEVDGEPLDPTKRLTYRSILFEDAPNAAVIFGYTNASWTLKVDLACAYFCRLVNYMDARGYTSVVPRDREGLKTEDSAFVGLSAGYVRRAADRLPRQGRRAPWKVLDDYLRDAPMMRLARLDDGCLEFAGGPGAPH